MQLDSCSGKVIVKIIDFDSAHIIGDSLTDETITRLHGTRHELAERELGGAADLRNYDVSLMNLLRRNIGNTQLWSDNKSNLDDCFRKLQISYLSG